MKFWRTISDDLKASKKVALLYVLQSEGSSPGRQGFKMKVNEDGIMEGSIGGGFMEHKLIELAKSKLKEGSKPFIKHQVHRKDAEYNQSGMICSGRQSVAFFFLSPSDKAIIDSIINCLQSETNEMLELSHQGINLIPKESHTHSVTIDQPSWRYLEPLGYMPHLYIIGGGHVSLALSQVMEKLGFHIVVLDDRKGLNTMVQNNHAVETHVINYKEVANHVLGAPGTYVVIMTFGYRPDKVVLKQLLGKDLKYLGMLGSEAKVDQLMDELQKEGLDTKLLAQIHAPIGVQIASQTPAEIAISIAAEIISIKNKPKTKDG